MRSLGHLAGRWLCGALAAALAGTAAPAAASTLMRTGLEELVATNATVVVAEVVDASSYWNAEGTLILTDVRVAPVEVLKGIPAEEELTVTVMGGTVGDLTVQVLGGAELVPGRSYVLFLNAEDLPGAPRALTVRDHVQGVFDLVPAGEGLRAVSQATSHPLVPDAFGRTEPPGGAEGLPFTALVRSLRELAAEPGRTRR